MRAVFEHAPNLDVFSKFVNPAKNFHCLISGLLLHRCRRVPIYAVENIAVLPRHQIFGVVSLPRPL